MSNILPQLLNASVPPPLPHSYIHMYTYIYIQVYIYTCIYRSMYEVAYRDMLGEWADVFAFRGRVEVSCAQDLAVTLERGVQSSVCF